MNAETTQHKRSTVYIAYWTMGEFGRHGAAFRDREEAVRMADMMQSKGCTDVVVTRVDSMHDVIVTEIEREKHGG